MIRHYQLPFNELTKEQLYQLLHLRNEVFIVEQNAPYQDLDEKDNKATHFLSYDETVLIGYGRVLFDSDKNAMSLGRLITKSTHRRLGVAKQLMTHMLIFLKTHYEHDRIVISAQSYLEKFYQSFGFHTTGKPYLEDGLPHLKMIRDSKGMKQ